MSSKGMLWSSCSRGWGKLVASVHCRHSVLSSLLLRAALHLFRLDSHQKRESVGLCVMPALEQQNCHALFSLHQVGTMVHVLVPPAAFVVLHLWQDYTLQSPKWNTLLLGWYFLGECGRSDKRSWHRVQYWSFPAWLSVQLKYSAWELASLSEILSWTWGHPRGSRSSFDKADITTRGV